MSDIKELDLLRKILAVLEHMDERLSRLESRGL